MMIEKFPWGSVVNRFRYDFDTYSVEVVKYLPKREYGCANVPEFHIEELSSSYNSLESAIIAYFAYKSLGLNQHALVSGICRALEIQE